MRYNPEIKFEDMVQADPTLKFFMRDAVIDYKRFDHQIDFIGTAIMIAINKWIDLKYK